MAFADNLAALPAVDHLAGIQLQAPEGDLTIIENKPGSAGSVRVYAHLISRHGEINAAAAEEGLALYAEHTEDARAHPGKHPNIDRLFHILASRSPGRPKNELDDLDDLAPSGGGSEGVSEPGAPLTTGRAYAASLLSKE